jgi:hypothetical protein
LSKLCIYQRFYSLQYCSTVVVSVVAAVYMMLLVRIERVCISKTRHQTSRTVSTQQAARVGQCLGIRLSSTDVLRGALGAMEIAEGSSETHLHARAGRDGALGEYTDALVSLQRLALAGLATGGAAGWDALLALSLTKVRFTGIDSMKVDREEEDMPVVL